MKLRKQWVKNSAQKKREENFLSWPICISLERKSNLWHSFGKARTMAISTDIKTILFYFSEAEMQFRVLFSPETNFFIIFPVLKKKHFRYPIRPSQESVNSTSPFLVRVSLNLLHQYYSRRSRDTGVQRTSGQSGVHLTHKGAPSDDETPRKKKKKTPQKLFFFFSSNRFTPTNFWRDIIVIKVQRALRTNGDS